MCALRWIFIQDEIEWKYYVQSINNDTINILYELHANKKRNILIVSHNKISQFTDEKIPLIESEGIIERSAQNMNFKKPTRIPFAKLFFIFYTFFTHKTKRRADLDFFCVEQTCS
jgi:hypothetical protein